MDLDTDDDVLSALAEGKSMDYEHWPSLLSRLIPRLEKVAQEWVPQVKESQPTSPPAESSSQTSTQDKENAPPPSTTSPETLPPKLQSDLTSITSTLTSLFSTYPPHTIQRLAELLLSPTQHYRTLPSYLHALERVVHVTSGAQTFPLPPAIPDPTAASVLQNGVLSSGADPLSISWGNPATTQPSLGSDESLGGALLTPITWITKTTNGSISPLEGEVKTESTEMIEGPNGPGGVETVSVSVNGVSSASPDTTSAILRAEGGVTQGELLRQEQKAGVVPAVHLQGHNRGSDPDEEEMPHARGPEEIGMEDMGPQGATQTQRGGPGVSMQGINVEAAVGRRIDSQQEEEEKDNDDMDSEGPRTPKREADSEIVGDEKRPKSDDDMVLVDADGNTEDEA